MHVGASHVQRPCYIVKRRHEHTVSMLRPQSLTNTHQLILSLLTGILQRMNDDLVFRHCLAVFPYLIKWVKISAERQSTLRTQFHFEVLDISTGISHAIKSHLFRPAVAQLLTEPLGYSRCFRHLQPHQFKLRSCQLCLGSDEIARVGPQCGTGHCHHHRPCRTVKPTYPFTPLPPLRHIFAIVWVGTWENKRSHMLSTHNVSQSRKPFGNHLVHIHIVY